MKLPENDDFGNFSGKMTKTSCLATEKGKGKKDVFSPKTSNIQNNRWLSLRFDKKTFKPQSKTRPTKQNHKFPKLNICNPKELQAQSSTSAQKNAEEEKKKQRVPTRK